MSRLALRVALCATLLCTATIRGIQAQWSLDALSVGRNGPAAVTADGKAYFAGGREAFANSDVVDIYDHASGGWSTATLSEPRTSIAATAVGHYVLFAGGTTSSTTSSAVVDVLDTDTMTWSATTLSSARSTVATTVGHKAIFAGGYGGGPVSPVSSAVVDVYDSDLGAPGDPGAWSTTTLSLARGNLAAATAGDFALFAGGRDDVLAGGNHTFNRVDIYDDTTGLWSTTTLSQARSGLAAASSGTRAWFAGGEFGNQLSDVVDVYDSQTGTFTSTTLAVPRTVLSAVALGDTIFFAGGFAGGGVALSVVEVLDTGTDTFGPMAELSVERGRMGATAVGDEALFAGGFGFAGSTDVIDVYDPTWTDVGPGLAGAGGVPVLSGSGPLTALSANSIDLSNAKPGGSSYLVLGLSLLGAPLKGGVLGPTPDVVYSGLPIDGSGNLDISLPWPAGVPVGFKIFVQHWIPDAGGPVGFAASNSLEAEAH